MSAKAAAGLSKLVVAVSLASSPMLGLAQDNSLDSIVVTANRSQSVLRDTPASIFSIGSEAMDRVRHNHIAELMTRVPGASISPTGGMDSLTAIRSPVLTGAGSCGAFQMSEDGIPLRGAGFCNVNQMAEANSEIAGGVEVIRGPGSILFGANALHGAINVLSRDISEVPETDLSVDFGSHQTNRLRMTHSDSMGDHGYRVSLIGGSTGGYKHDAGQDQQKLSLKHRFSRDNFSVTSNVHVNNINQETAGSIQGPEVYKDDDMKRVNPNPEAYKDARSYRLSSRLEWDLGNTTLNVTPYYRNIEVTFLQHFLPGVPLEEQGHESWGLQSMLASQGNDPLQWRVGVDMELSSGFLKETQEHPTEGTAFLVGTIPVGKHYDYEVDARLISPYAQLQYRLSSADSLTLGLRYEEMKYDYNNRMIDGRAMDNGTPCGFGGCRFNRPADRTDTYDNASVQLGWIHDFADSQQLYVNLSQAFRAPDTSEVYRLQNEQNVADLDSEEADSYEIGFRSTQQWGSYSVAAYHMDKDNVIFQDSNRTNISGASTRHRGVELNASFSLRNDLLLSIATAYARHTYEDDLQGLQGNEMDTAPRLNGSAQLRWQISAARSIELEWVHVDSYYTDEANTAEYDGHDLVNLRYQSDLGDKWYYAARITNLFDTDYAERADFAFGNDRYWVGEPRSVYFSVGTRF